MKAFTQAIVAMLAITVIAVVGLRMVPMSSSQVYQDRPNVRL
jgi:hypothetical protein